MLGLGAQTLLLLLLLQLPLSSLAQPVPSSISPFQQLFFLLRVQVLPASPELQVHPKDYQNRNHADGQDLLRKRTESRARSGKIAGRRKFSNQALSELLQDEHSFKLHCWSWTRCDGFHHPV
jgi:hypothetical protein